jgi:hypothetical protein
MEFSTYLSKTFVHNRPFRNFIESFDILFFSWYIAMLDRYIGECMGVNSQHQEWYQGIYL